MFTRLLSLKKQGTKKKNKTKQNQQQQQQQTTSKQIKTAAKYYSPCLHGRWRCDQAIAQNDQQLGPTSLALLSL